MIQLQQIIHTGTQKEIEVRKLTTKRDLLSKIHHAPISLASQWIKHQNARSVGWSREFFCVLNTHTLAGVTTDKKPEVFLAFRGVGKAIAGWPVFCGVDI